MSLYKRLLFGVVLLGAAAYGSVGKISAHRGETSLQREERLITLKTGLALEEQDTLTTGKDGQAQMVFIDKTVVTVGSGTVFKVEEYLFDETQAKAKFHIGSGIFKAITGKIGKLAPENFSIRTKTAVIGIRGTIIRGKIGADTDTILCEQGVISVTSLITGQVYILKTGELIILRHDGSSVEFRTITPGALEELGIEEEFVIRTTPAKTADIRAEEVPSSGETSPLFVFENPAAGLQNIVPESAGEALDRNRETMNAPWQESGPSAQ